jgi:hypothetical protein
MAYSSLSYTGDGTTKDFAVTFDYLDQSHVKVRVDKVFTYEVGSNYTFEFINSTTVRVTHVVSGDAPVSGAEVEVLRRTPIDAPAVVFGVGASLTSEDLNKNSEYLTYALQEATDANDLFTQLYLGAFSAAPATDNDGEALLTGASYFDTDDNILYFWNGSAWKKGDILENSLAAQAAAEAAQTAAELAEAGSQAAQTAAELAQANAETAETNAAASAVSAAASAASASATLDAAILETECVAPNAVKALDQGVATTDAPDFSGLNVDGGTLFVNSALNRVGIGTETPSAPLEISGNFNSGFFLNDTGGTTCDLVMADTGGSARFRLSSGTWSIYAGGDGNSVNAANSSLAFRAAANGDVSFWNEAGNAAGAYWDASALSFGIGTSTPQAPLHINATDAIIPARGTTAQRPTGVEGMLRYNYDTKALEIYDGSAWTGAGSGGGSVEEMYVEEQTASGVGNGTMAASDDNVRPLNTVVINTITGASLASNVITIPAGTYWIDARFPGCFVNYHRARMIDVSSGTTLIDLGSTAFCHSSFGPHTDSFIKGRYTFASAVQLEFRHYAQTARAGDGMGVASNDSRASVHGTVYIKKEG